MKEQKEARLIVYRAILLLIISFLVLTARAEDNDSNAFQWQEVAPIPPGGNSDIQYGLAAPFAGYTNGKVIVAGGCNFPDEPVYEGGVKRYYDDIFVYDPEIDTWNLQGKFPYPVSYGASVSTTFGIVCIGGNNTEESFSKVHLLSWNDEEQKAQIAEWPDLPYRMTNFGAALVDDIIYIAGGLANDQLANKFLSLDLTQINNPNFSWQELEDFPGPARLQPVAVGQNAAEESHFYLFSGSSFPEQAFMPNISVDGLEYNPKSNQWSKVSDITTKNGSTYSLHGASGIPIGTHHILFIGGVNKDKFREGLLLERRYADAARSGDSSQIESASKEKHAYFTHPPEWYAFNRDVLVYHTITDTWVKADDYPFSGPAGAPLVKVNDSWLVINGEIKPGVRTPRVVRGSAIRKPDFG